MSAVTVAAPQQHE